jgi:hypothetical protein
MDVVYDNLVDENSSEDEQFSVHRVYRPRFNLEALTNTQVVRKFRLQRQTILALEARIRDDLQSLYPNRKTDLTPLLQLLIAIR